MHEEKEKIEIWIENFVPADFLDKSLVQTINRSSLGPISTIRTLANPTVKIDPQTLKAISISSNNSSSQQTKSTNSKIQIALGSKVYQSFTNSPGVSVDSDQAFVISKQNQIIIPSISHRDIFKDPINLTYIELAFRKAYNIYNNKSIDPQPNLLINPSLREILDFIERAKQTPIISIDFETLTTNYEITCIGIAISDTESISIPLAGQYLIPLWSELEELEIWNAFNSLLQSSNLKVFHNFIFDTLVLSAIKLPIHPNLDDTLIRANYLNPLLPKKLGDVARLYLYSEPWKDVKDYNLTGDVDHFYRYNALDALYTLRIYHKQVSELKFRKLDITYDMYVKPLLPIVLDTCNAGINVDQIKLNEIKSKLESILDPIKTSLKAIGNPLISKGIKKKKLRDKPNDRKDENGNIIKAYKEVQESIDREFNPSSPEQVKEILTTIGYKVPTKKGKESSDREALLKLNRREPHPFITNMLQYQRYQKLKSSYADIVLDADGRCRFSYKIAGTISGRFGCEKTLFDTGLNIQTIPREDEIGIKSIFIPNSPEDILLEVDLSQAELRVVAWISNEHKLIKLLDENQDIHQFVADQITKLTGLACPRQLGKRVNHAKNYGMGPKKFMDSCLIEADIELTLDDAIKLLNAHSAMFPSVAAWQAAIRSEIVRTRRLSTPTGRQMQFFGPIDDETHRKALSFIPQGTVADTINSAWIDLTKLPNYKQDLVVLAQIHDSLLLNVKKAKLDSVIEQINSVFSRQYLIINNIKRQIPWDYKSGPNWSAMRKLK